MEYFIMHEMHCNLFIKTILLVSDGVLTFVLNAIDSYDFPYAGFQLDNCILIIYIWP